jgi:hypothetical protein
MKEALNNKDGVSDHSTWRNYDDLNEFFWLDTTISCCIVLVMKVY